MKLKERKFRGLLLCVSIDGREGVALAEWGEAFCHPVELMRAAPAVSDLEAIAAGIQARKEGAERG